MSVTCTDVCARNGSLSCSESDPELIITNKIISISSFKFVDLTYELI